MNDKTRGNYLLQLTFPWDSETLEYMARNQEMVEAIGRLAGTSFVLSGCELSANGTECSEGYVYLQKEDGTGEVLRLKPGIVTTGVVHMVRTSIPVSAGGNTYAQAYEERHLEWGYGDEQYNWADFAILAEIAPAALKARIDTLEEQISTIQPEPIGTIKMWPSATLPTGGKYLMCDGGTIPQGSEYDTLRGIVGNTTPNLKGRFVVGYDVGDGQNDTDSTHNYTRIGNMGGERTHQLTEDEMPSHSHNVPGSGYVVTQGNATEWKGLSTRATEARFGTSETGRNLAHENRPPYYVLAYIIRAKL